MDSIILNKEDEYISRTEDGSRYIVKRWFSGRECDVRRPADILEAAGNLEHLFSAVPLQLRLEGVQGDGAAVVHGLGFGQGGGLLGRQLLRLPRVDLG